MLAPTSGQENKLLRYFTSSIPSNSESALAKHRDRTSLLGWSWSGTMMGMHPARHAASMPAGESSMARQFSGATPMAVI